MQVKALEIRDSATFIPALAIAVESANEGQRYLLRRAGYGLQERQVILTRIAGGRGEATCDPYNWPGGTRTMREAHQWIIDHWDELADGDVVDVQFVIGETETKKVSERHEFGWPRLTTPASRANDSQKCSTSLSAD